MRVVLKPVSHPQIGEIDIGGDLFAVGRNEEPFAQLGAAAGRLSRRHARIFQEGDQVFVADLGSLNGTQVNERRLEDGAAPLHDDDLVTFGEELSFRVEIKPEAHTAALAPPVRLLLVPTNPTSGLEEIAIERFPFLVARVESVFEQYADRFPEALRKLSRRHAVIALKGGEVYVEDLESANGTYVDGEKLDERARKLADGDIVMFGTPYFSYTVHLDAQDEATQLVGTMRVADDGTVIASPEEPVAIARSATAEARAVRPAIGQSIKSEPVFAKPQASKRAEAISAFVPEPEEPLGPESEEPVGKAAFVDEPGIGAVPQHTGSRTRFVSSADSFINVFCAEDAKELAEKPLADASDTSKVEALKRPAGRLQRARAAIGEFWRAVNGPTRVNRRIAWAVGIMAVALVAAAGTTYLLGADRRDIKALLDEGQYADSASIANRYLARHADDREAERWAEEAMTKAVVPAWMGYIEKGRFEDAALYLQKQAAKTQSIPNSKELLDTLAWAGRVQAHMAERGPSGRITLFKHEQPIKQLVAEWEADSFRRQQIMDQVLTRTPAFETIHSRVFSDLRTLRSDAALYVKAMEELDANVTAALQRNDREGVERLIGDFAGNYTQAAGLEALREDLARYDQLRKLAQEQQLLELVQASRQMQFRTPSFARHVEEWLASTLPPQSVIDKHAAASRAWRAGRHQQAIAMLEPLTRDASPESWGAVAAKQIDRYRKVQGDYDDLLASRQSPAYWDKLLLVWSSLRPTEDEHLKRALQADFAAYRERMLPQLDASMRRGQSFWNEYQSAGGIPGVVRVEGRVSGRFAGQAKRLSSAYTEVTHGARTYQLLQTPMPAEWQTLHEQVADEVQRQRRWLEDLNIVLEPALLRAKLALLPQEQEQSLWAQSTTAHEQD